MILCPVLEFRHGLVLLTDAQQLVKTGQPFEYQALAILKQAVGMLPRGLRQGLFTGTLMDKHRQRRRDTDQLIHTDPPTITLLTLCTALGPEQLHRRFDS
ncbi:hypothetical protein D3C85_1555890 [compost metagenome]